MRKLVTTTSIFGLASTSTLPNRMTLKSTAQLEQAAITKHLGDNAEYIMAQLNENKISYNDVSQSLKDEHPEIQKVGLEINGLSLKHIAHESQSMEDVLAAVSQNGLALEFASPSFKKHHTILKTAVKENGLALKFVDPSLEIEEPDLYFQIVLEASKNSSSALETCSEDLANTVRDTFMNKLIPHHENDDLPYKTYKMMIEESLISDDYDDRLSVEDENEDHEKWLNDGIDLDDANKLIREMPICKYDPSELYIRMIKYFKHDNIIRKLDEETSKKFQKIMAISTEPSLDESMKFVIKKYGREDDNIQIKYIKEKKYAYGMLGERILVSDSDSDSDDGNRFTRSI